MKMFKKVVSVFLSMCLTIGMSSTVFADEISSTKVLPSNVEVLADDENFCIVKEYTDEGMTVATNNKQNGILTIEKYDFSGENLLSVEALDLNAIASNSVNSSIQSPSSTYANKDYVYKYQNTFSNREYSILIYNDGSPSFWTVRISSDSADEKCRYEDSSNTGNLNNFRTAVEDINNAELVIIAGAPLAAVAIIAGVVAGGAAGGIAAAGSSGLALSVPIANLNTSINNADYYYSLL